MPDFTATVSFAPFALAAKFAEGYKIPMPTPESTLRTLADRLRDLRHDARRLPASNREAVEEMWKAAYQSIGQVRKADTPEARKRRLQMIHKALGKCVRVARANGITEVTLAQFLKAAKSFGEALETAYPPEPPPPPQPRKCTFHLKTSSQ